PMYHRTPPEGGLVIYVTTKVLGGYDRPKDEQTEVLQQSLGRDHLWVEKNEAQELAAGKVAERLKRRMACFHLLDNTRGEPAWWDTSEIRKMELVISADRRMAGTVHTETKWGSRGFKAELFGLIEVDHGMVTRFDLAANGEAWGETRYNQG